jgi:hypothetical protein
MKAQAFGIVDRILRRRQRLGRGRVGMNKQALSETAGGGAVVIEAMLAPCG